MATPSGSLYKELELFQFGGLNNRDTSNEIDDYQASDLLNVHFDNRKEITKRNGYTAFLSAQINANPIVSQFNYLKSSGTNYLLATSGVDIYNITSGTASSIKTGLTSDKRFTSAVYKDILYMVNSADGLMKWDGTTFSTVGALPFANVKYIIVHKNRMYYAGDTASPSRVWFSDLGAPETVGGLSFFDINTNDGDSITGISELLDTLIIFKERSIHPVRGTGPQNLIVQDAHQAHGSVSHWSIVQILNKLFYLSRDGVYSFDGRNVHLESDLIRGSVRGINSQIGWNQSKLDQSCAIEFQNKYWLAVPEGASQLTNNRIFLLDYIHHYWTRYDIPVSCFSLFPTSNTYLLYTGSTTVGKIYKQDTATSDDGTAINAYLRTKDFDFKAAAHFKSFKGLEFLAREANSQYSVNITYYEDFGKTTKTIALSLGPRTSTWGPTGTLFWGQTWGSSKRVVSKTTSVSGQCRYLGFQVGDNSANPWTFLGFVIRYKVKRRLV